jgi:hypothetical protein
VLNSEKLLIGTWAIVLLNLCELKCINWLNNLHN